MRGNVLAAACPSTDKKPPINRQYYILKALKKLEKAF
jgi:hypothetical protein